MKFFDYDKQKIDNSISSIKDFRTFKSAVLQICNAYIQMSETPLTKEQKSYQSSFSRKKQVQNLKSTLDSFNLQQVDNQDGSSIEEKKFIIKLLAKIHEGTYGNSALYKKLKRACESFFEIVSKEFKELDSEDRNYLNSLSLSMRIDASGY